MIGREVAVTGVRAIAAAEGIVLSAETTGKYKMTAQVLAILFLIMAESVDPTWNFSTIGNVLLYSALMLGLISGTQYLVTFWREISLKGLCAYSHALYTSDLYDRICLAAHRDDGRRIPSRIHPVRHRRF